jgi:Domain of unknown function (DUF4845)
MLRKQRGVTMIGWICLLIPIAIVGYAGIRLAPSYMTYGKVARVMEQTAKESTGETSQVLIRTALEKRLDIEIIEFPDTKDFTLRREGQSWVLEISYEDPVPFFGNVSLVPKFEKSVRIGAAPSD